MIFRNAANNNRVIIPIGRILLHLQTNKAVDKSKETIRIQSWILVVAILLFSIKIIAWYLTHSVAILTDALESIVNIIAGLVGYYSLSRLQTKGYQSSLWSWKSRIPVCSY